MSMDTVQQNINFSELFKKYISFEQSVEIRIYPPDIQVLFLRNPLQKDETRAGKAEKTYHINGTASEIISRINGLNTYEELIRGLSIHYKEDFDSINSKVSRFLVSIVNSYGVKIRFSDEKIANPVSVRTEENLYPTVATIELTSKCNLKCLHCYGDYGVEKDSTISLSDVKKILFDFKNLGVRMIEFTGGDITMHPNLKEIILEALSYNFKQIALLTNGIALSDEVMEIIIKNKNVIVVQIDLHSLDDEYLKWFTKASNTLEKIQYKIKYLNDNGVLLRVATIITPKNLHEIESIAEWVHNIGCKSYAVSSVVNMGRAISTNRNDESQLLLNTPELITEFYKKVEYIDDKHNNFINLIEDAYSSQGTSNCGAITSNVSISSNGRIKLCSLDNLEYFRSSFGNVLEKNIKDIYDQNADFIQAIYNQQSPKHNSAECSDCENKVFCGNCILRGFIMYKKLGRECKWGSTKISHIIKERFFD